VNERCYRHLDRIAVGATRVGRAMRPICVECLTLALTVLIREQMEVTKRALAVIERRIKRRRKARKRSASP
jgi:hypothetical protein